MYNCNPCNETPGRTFWETGNCRQPWLADVIEACKNSYYKIETTYDDSISTLTIHFEPQTEWMQPVADVKIPITSFALNPADSDHLGAVKADPADIYDTDFVHIDSDGRLRFAPNVELYLAVIGVNTFDDILTAYKAGKYVVATPGGDQPAEHLGKIYTPTKLIGLRSQPDQFEFSCADSDGVSTWFIHKSGSSGYTNRPYGYVTPEMFGAKGDGVKDDTQAFVDALAASSVVIVPEGRYIVKNLEIPAEKTIIGMGHGSVIIGNFHSDFGARSRISNLYFNPGNKSVDAISGKWAFCRFDHLSFRNCNSAFNFDYGTWINSFSDIYVGVSHSAFTTPDQFNAIDITGLHVQQCDTVFNVPHQARMVSVHGGDFEMCKNVYVGGGAIEFNVDDCYIEEITECVFKPVHSCVGGRIAFNNCYFYPPKNATDGWIVTDLREAQYDFHPGELWFDGCTFSIGSSTKKPFSCKGAAFCTINVINSRFASGYYPAYMDLFTAETQYNTQGWHRHMVTDLPIVREYGGHLEFYSPNRGTASFKSENFYIRAIGTSDCSTAYQSEGFWMLPCSNYVTNFGSKGNTVNQAFVKYDDGSTAETFVRFNGGRLIIEDSLKKPQKPVELRMDCTYTR